MVDDLWFTHAAPGRVLGVPVLLCPPEEMIWSKAFIMERERYDGADVAHLILACGRELDWRPPAGTLRPAVACAVEPPHPLRLHLSGRAGASSPTR